MITENKYMYYSLYAIFLIRKRLIKNWSVIINFILKLISANKYCTQGYFQIVLFSPNHGGKKMLPCFKFAPAQIWLKRCYLQFSLSPILDSSTVKKMGRNELIKNLPVFRSVSIHLT